MDVAVGDRVRIRVSGKRRRGYVTAIYDRPVDKKLLPVEGSVGSLASFSERDLELLRWCASYYVSPLSTILKRTVPPNLPRAEKPQQCEQAVPTAGGSPSYLIGSAPHGTRVRDLLGANLKSGESALVIAPSVVEATAIAEALEERFPGLVALSHSDEPAATQTKAWEQAATVSGTILVGTREVVLWPVRSLAHVLVLEESRRVMRSPSTPTLGVREIALRRARSMGVPITFVGPLPSSEVIHHGASVDTPDGRWWPLVEVVDRREEPPSSSPLLERTRAAIARAASTGNVFVLVPRRGDAASYRCMRCDTLRRCTSCGSAADSAEACRRCGTALEACEECSFSRFRPLGTGIGLVRDDIARVLGDDVGVMGDGRAVTVGTERDLVALTGNVLAVAVDFDGSALAPNYRAGETTLRLLARLAGTVARGRGHRCIVQTSDPSQPVVEAFRAGVATDFLNDEATIRRRSGFPPFGELLAIEIAFEGDTEPIDGRLREAVGDRATILGPAEMGERLRWLVQAPDLSEAKLSLRPFVRSLRDRGGRVRVDVDPIDL